MPRFYQQSLEPVRPDLFNFLFASDGNFKEKFERLAEVLGVENPLKNMAEVFEKVLDNLALEEGSEEEA